MTRYVIGPDVAIRLAHDEAVIYGGHQILAPTLLRSQVLSLQTVAWKAAVLLGWPDTFDQLHADALITLDRQLADAVKDLVTVAALEALYWPPRVIRAVLPRKHAHNAE